MPRNFFAVILLTLVTSAGSAEPPVAKTDLFTAGQEGYALYRIPGILLTKQGTLLAYCEARKSDKGDWGTIDILQRRSTDGGKTWGPRQHIAHHGERVAKNPVALAQKLATEGEQTVNNPVLIAGRDGTVHFLYCLEYARCFYARSTDDGQTYSPPTDITATFESFRPDYDWKVLATGPAHGIELKSGRLVVPVWLSTGTGGHAHRPSITSTIYSDDQGQMWQRGEVAVPNTADWINPNETVIVELADGRVMLNVRSESKTHRRLVVSSPDGATGWSSPKFQEDQLEPICMASLVRHSLAAKEGKNRLLFANPHNLARADSKEQPGVGRDRKNLTIKLSEDDGATWPVSRALEEGFSGYSDLAVGPDGNIYCFYERGTTDGKSIYKSGALTVAKFNLDWVLGK